MTLYNVSMVPDIEMEGKSNILIETSATKQSYGCIPEDPQSKFIARDCNIDGENLSTRHVSDGKAGVQNGSDDVEIDITGCTESSDRGLVETESQIETETSSSFGETICGTENVSTLNDIEVESQYNGGYTLESVFDGYSKELPIRKKRLTEHWRKFVHPVMWRCKWLELQIKELRSQALKCDRELAEHSHRKQLEFEKLLVEGRSAKSWSFSCHVQNNQVMKRKRRKRIEETTDIASYMSKHNLFSYNDRRSVADGVFLDNHHGNLGNKGVNAADELDFNEQSLIFIDGDNSLEILLWKIEMLQSKIRKLKTRVDKVVSENPGKFCSVNRLSVLVPCSALTGSDGNATSPENGNRMLDRSLCISSQHISDECNNMGDLFIPESVVSSQGELNPLPNMLGTTDQPQNKEGIMLEDKASEEELHNFERAISRLTDKNRSTSVAAKAPAKPSVSHGQPSTSRSNLRSNKRKQKSRSSRWTRKRTG